jgi:hypothetical protein
MITLIEFFLAALTLANTMAMWDAFGVYNEKTI